MRTSTAHTILLSLVAAGAIELAISAQGTTPPPATPPPAAGQGANGNTPAPTPPPRPAAPALPADQTAYNAAVATVDPAAKLAALKKFQADFPKSGGIASAENAILDVLLTSFPDRTSEIEPLVDKQIAAISATSSSTQRIAQVTTLANKLLDKGVCLDRVDALLGNNIESILSDQVKEQEKERLTMRGRALEVQGRLHYGKGDLVKAERELRDAVAANASLTFAPLTLARIDSKKGNDKAALAGMMSVAALNKLKPEDDTFLRELYKKVNGKDAGLDEDVDKVYRTKNPAVPTPYKKTAGRTNRLVLAEMFTGSACPPCVAADLAMDAALERYPDTDLVLLAYHEHIPGPDPMVVAGSRPRFAFYAGSGVPTFVLDGNVDPTGGGARENAGNKYNSYVGMIDKALEVAPSANVAVKASNDGKTIKVTATVSNVDAAAKNVKLQVVLAEHELRFVGENNIRLHTMVVRGIAGEKQEGFTVNAAGETTAEWTFDLAAIKADVTKQIADEITRVRGLAGAVPTRVYNAEGHAMTGIDLSKLSVVAFVQDGDKHILQATRFDLK